MGFGDGTVEFYTARVMTALLHIRGDVIAWPDSSERRQLKQYTEDRHIFPDCLGFVDGTHVVLSEKPSRLGEDYFNRKHSYSIAAMIIYDIHKRIRYTFAGYCGSVHDSRVWGCSPIGSHQERYLLR